MSRGTRHLGDWQEALGPVASALLKRRHRSLSETSDLAAERGSNNDGGIGMNKTEMKGNWNVIKGKLKQRWGQLTDDDLQYVEGQEQELIGRIQKRTGETRESVERAFDEATTPRHASGRSGI